MPLRNSHDMAWTGWLIDGLGGKESEFAGKLTATLEAREIPKSTVRRGTVNMWWRKDSVYIDVTSSMDGTITSTIHVQEYAGSLFIGRAAESQNQTNYYKRMAAASFVWTVDACINGVVEQMSSEAEVHLLSDAQRPVPSTA